MQVCLRNENKGVCVYSSLLGLDHLDRNQAGLSVLMFHVSSGVVWHHVCVLY